MKHTRRVYGNRKFTKYGLTLAEVQIADRVSLGATNDSIAKSLKLSERTVKTHLYRIYKKVGKKGRAFIAMWWMECV